MSGNNGSGGYVGVVRNDTNSSNYHGLLVSTMYDTLNSTVLHLKTNTADPTTGGTDLLKVTGDGRGLSEFTAKAWVNFNGTGTIAIRDSHNVSSLTDVNTGNYKYNYTNAMTTANYAYVGGVGEWNLWTTGNTPNTAYSNLNCFNGSGLVDHAYLMAITFGA